jgi:hypothetical protein
MTLSVPPSWRLSERMRLPLLGPHQGQGGEGTGNGSKGGEGLAAVDGR